MDEHEHEDEDEGKMNMRKRIMRTRSGMVRGLPARLLDNCTFFTRAWKPL